GGEVFVEEFLELGFVVPRVDLRRPAVHVEVDQAFGRWRAMRKPGKVRVDAVAGGGGRCGVGAQRPFAEKRSEGDPADAQADVAEELAAGHRKGLLNAWVHD